MSLESDQNCTVKHCPSTNFSALTNDSLARFQTTEMPLAEILKLTLQVLIAFLGVTGNTFVAIVIGRAGKKRTSADFYVQNLAIADLGTLLLTFPIAAIKEKLPLNWPLGEFACLYLSPVPEIFYGSSVWCIAAIAIERYRKILTVHAPSQNKTKASLRSAKVAVACVWVMSFLFFCLPLYFVVEYRDLPNGGKWCGPGWPSFLLERVYIGLLTVFSYIIPLAVISFTYFQISRAINQSSIFFKAMAQEQQGTGENVQRAISLQNARLNQNKRARKILTPLVLVFAASMFPLSVLRLIIAFWPTIVRQKYYENLVYAVGVFVIFNSSANPIIYSVVSKGFRSKIMKLICGRKKAGSVNFSGIFRSILGSSHYRDSGHQFSNQQVKQQVSSFPVGIFKKIDSE